MMMKNQTLPTSKHDDLQKIIHHLSHDLGAPLRHAINFAFLLSTDHQANMNEEARQWLRHIRESTEKAQSMINGLLEYSRIFGIVQTAQKLDLNEIWDFAQFELKQIIEQKTTTITATKLPKIQGVKQHWITLFSALLKNSLLYQPAGQTPIIHLSHTYSANGELTLIAQDNGIGVDEKYHEELTDFFRRLHTDEEYPGIGMGLTICERILQYCNGRINFTQSKLGGLEVHCVLPNIIA